MTEEKAQSEQFDRIRKIKILGCSIRSNIPNAHPVRSLSRFLIYNSYRELQFLSVLISLLNASVLSVRSSLIHRFALLLISSLFEISNRISSFGQTLQRFTQQTVLNNLLNYVLHIGYKILHYISFALRTKCINMKIVKM